MCDHHYHPGACQSCFLHDYMHQHAAMMQWMQQLHQTIPAHNPNYDYEHRAANFQPQYPVNERRNRPSSQASHTFIESSVSSISQVELCETGVKDKDSFEDSESEESEYEYELNVDAILAMRAAKEELKKASEDSDSFILVDSEKEEFEFVELGSLKTLESKRARGVGSSQNTNDELQTEKQIMKYLYGAKSPTIAGLETAMAINFERLCDTHQPPLWPVLPVRL